LTAFVRALAFTTAFFATAAFATEVFARAAGWRVIFGIRGI
jgi:hypothetical protein